MHLLYPHVFVDRNNRWDFSGRDFSELINLKWGFAWRNDGSIEEKIKGISEEVDIPIRKQAGSEQVPNPDIINKSFKCSKELIKNLISDKNININKTTDFYPQPALHIFLRITWIKKMKTYQKKTGHSNKNLWIWLI